MIVPGGLVGMGIKFLTTPFFLFKLSEMTWQVDGPMKTR